MMRRTTVLAQLSIAVVALIGAAVLPTTGVVGGEAPTNGKIAFQSSRPVDENWFDNIWVMESDGTGQTRLTGAPGQHAGPAFSPDGSHIAFHSTRDGGNPEIYVMNADGTDQTRLTDNPASDTWPAWSPDGSRIAFVSDRDGNNEIYVMNADGTDQTGRTHTTSNEGFPAWSPDGTQIAFSSDRDRNDSYPPNRWEIYVMNADGTSPTRLTDNAILDDRPAWSPDGTKLAFQRGAGSGSYIWIMDADGSGQTSLALGGGPAWSPDGTKLAYSRFGSAFWQIWTVNADGTAPTNVTSGAEGTNVFPAWGVVPAPDTTPPSVTLATPADGAEYLLGATVLVDYTCEDELDGSGLTSCVGDLPTGSPLDTSIVGPASFSVTGIDGAGNSTTVTHDYTVVWNFTGFSLPVDNPPVVNTVKAGQAVPVKFGLDGDQGLAIFGDAPASRPVLCDNLAVTDAIEQTVAAGGSSLSYDPTNDQYMYVWKTSKNWAGTCRQLVVSLADGTAYVANFQLK